MVTVTVTQDVNRLGAKIKEKMSKNLQSQTKLTEFAPLQPEEKQQGVGQFISKLFGFTRTPVESVPENSDVCSYQEAVPTWAVDSASEASSPRDESAGDGDERTQPNVLKRIRSLLALKSNVSCRAYRQPTFQIVLGKNIRI